MPAVADSDGGEGEQGYVVHSVSDDDNVGKFSKFMRTKKGRSVCRLGFGDMVWGNAVDVCLGNEMMLKEAEGWCFCGSMSLH